MALSACGELQSPDGRNYYTSTGELIALSGGDAGAANACHTCHGLAGEGDGAGTPRLSGMPFGYLVKQLEDFADGRRRHPEMRQIALRLDPGERQAVARWYAQRDIPETVASDGAASQAAVSIWTTGDADRGIPPCAACHGLLGEGLGAANPPLFGQPPAYLEGQLSQWRTGKRQSGSGDVMLLVSRHLTAREIADVSAYAARLSGPTAVASGREPFPPERRPGQ